MPAVPRKNKGTTLQFKATSGGSYVAIKGVQKVKLPLPVNASEDITPLEGPVVVEGNTVNDWGNVEIELLLDLDDTQHQAMLAACGADDCFIKATLPSGRTMEFSGNAKELSDTDRTAKNYSRITWKMHCNVEPTFVAAEEG